MGKRDEKQARADIQAEKSRQSARTGTFLTEKEAQAGDARERENTYRSSVYGGYKGFADTGGFGDDENTALQGYKQFAQTGGLDPETAQKIRTRASLAPTGYYQSLQNQLQRNVGAQGGYSPGLATGMARLGRHGAQAGAEATLNADIGIEDLIRSGKLAGLGGIESMTGARRAGQLAGIGGIGDLYRSVPGESSALDANRLAAMGLDANTITALLSQQSQLATRPGLFENILRGVGAGAGVLTSITGAAGGGK